MTNEELNRAALKVAISLYGQGSQVISIINAGREYGIFGAKNYVIQVQRPNDSKAFINIDEKNLKDYL